MSEDTKPTDIKLPATLDAGMETLRERYADQYDVRMVPSVRVLNTGTHLCRCTIRVPHGEFSDVSEFSYLEAFQDALQQALVVSP